MRKNIVALEVDDRVQIISGDHAGSCGAVAWLALDAIWITLDGDAEPLPFAWREVQKEENSA